MRGNWAVRALKRQIATLYFERSGLSAEGVPAHPAAWHAAGDCLPGAQLATAGAARMAARRLLMVSAFQEGEDVRGNLCGSPIAERVNR